MLGAGDRVTGATVHLVDERYDHGPVLTQRQVPVLPGDSPGSLQERVMAMKAHLLVWTLGEVAAGRLALGERGTVRAGDGWRRPRKRSRPA